MDYNTLELGTMGDFGELNCQYTKKVDAKLNDYLTTLPVIEPKGLLAIIPFHLTCSVYS